MKIKALPPVIDQFETPIEFDRMCMSNSLQVAAYNITKGVAWWKHLSDDESEWIYTRAKDKYHSMSEFRKTKNDEKFMYLLFLARAVRMGIVPSPLEDLIMNGIKL